MTYTEFVTDVEKGSRLSTTFPGIQIVESASSPTFHLIVREALKHLYETKIGKQLIDQIVASSPADNRGFKMLISRVDPQYKMVVMDGEPSGYKMTSGGGSGSTAKPVQQRLGVGSDAASTAGKGASALIGWNQTQVKYTPPSGANKGVQQYVPPPVTLGHELIHGLHALTGVSKSGHTIAINGKNP